MSEQIMFSVELLSYNQKNYISQALESILQQEHCYKYEILVSDDCSTDGTQEIIKEFHKKYPDIIKPVYNEKNLGAMQNYYATISRAKGKYLMDCAGDDYWLPGKVKVQIDFMENNSSFGICYSKAKLLDNDTNTITDEIGSNYLDFKEFITQGNKCPELTLCTKTELLQKYLCEIIPQNKNWLMEDYPFLIYAAFNSKIYFIDEPLAVYRIVKGSLSHQTDIEKILRYEKSINDIKKYFGNLYNLSVPDLNVNKLKKQIIHDRSVVYKLLKGIERIIKLFVPYGIIVLLRKIAR